MVELGIVDVAGVAAAFQLVEAAFDQMG